MPPFSPVANGVLPNSRNEFCPEKPCHPSVATQGGSIRPVDSRVLQVTWWVVVLTEQTLGPSLLAGPAAIDFPPQSAPAQYTEPGKRSEVGKEIVSAVFAMLPAIFEFPQGAVVELQVPSAGPPASYTTCVPVLL